MFDQMSSTHRVHRTNIRSGAIAICYCSHLCSHLMRMMEVKKDRERERDTARENKHWFYTLAKRSGHEQAKSDPLDLHKNDGTKTMVFDPLFFLVYLHDDGETCREGSTKKRDFIMGPTVNRQCRGTVLGSFFILNKKPWNWVSFILSSSVRTLFCLFFFAFPSVLLKVWISMLLKMQIEKRTKYKSDPRILLPILH